MVLRYFLTFWPCCHHHFASGLPLGRLGASYSLVAVASALRVHTWGLLVPQYVLAWKWPVGLRRSSGRSPSASLAICASRLLELTVWGIHVDSRRLLAFFVAPGFFQMAAIFGSLPCSLTHSDVIVWGGFWMSTWYFVVHFGSFMAC